MRDVSYHVRVHVLHGFVLLGRRRPRAGKEEVIVGRVDVNGHVRVTSEACLPAREVIGHSCLVVSAALQDEDRPVESSRAGAWIVATQVQPVGGGHAERQLA